MNDRFMLELNFKTADGKPVPDVRYTVNIKRDGIIWHAFTGTTKTEL